ncbi:hypothetical protein CNMCM6106_007902 [Aspergillus hiratsukae]|uniref:Uncharacterized protein n=1 Tax=Aspergillus hiratsukae TaxID=1194566 RepID=A0A8H6V0A0_9EURO|nr:hypothetical protein CNMCM6106_007902 [Aspergillus hiratsukae]
MQLIYLNIALTLLAITCSAGPIAQFIPKVRDLEQNSHTPGPIAYPSPPPLGVHVPAASNEANGGLDVIPVTPSVTADGTQAAVPQASYTSTEIPGSSMLPAEGHSGTVTPSLSAEVPLPSSTADSSPATVDSGTSRSTEIPGSSTLAGVKHASATAPSSARATLPSSKSSEGVIPTTSHSHSASHSLPTPSVSKSTTSTSMPVIKHSPTAGSSPQLSAVTPISIAVISPSAAPASAPTTTSSLTIGVVGPLSDGGTTSSSTSTTFFATSLPETTSTPTVTETTSSSLAAGVHLLQPLYQNLRPQSQQARFIALPVHKPHLP